MKNALVNFDRDIQFVGIELRLGLRDDAESAGDSDQFAFRVDPGLFVLEDVLESNHVAFHALNFGDGDALAAAVRQSVDLDNEVNGAGDLLTDGQLRQIHSR